jgi:hypothetical protein
MVTYHAHDDIWLDKENGVIVDGRGGNYGPPEEARSFALALLETANAYIAAEQGFFPLTYKGQRLYLKKDDK